MKVKINYIETLTYLFLAALVPAHYDPIFAYAGYSGSSMQTKCRCAAPKVSAGCWNDHCAPVVSGGRSISKMGNRSSPAHGAGPPVRGDPSVGSCKKDHSSRRSISGEKWSRPLLVTFPVGVTAT